jgi:hypothetical protein
VGRDKLRAPSTAAEQEFGDHEAAHRARPNCSTRRVDLAAIDVRSRGQPGSSRQTHVEGTVDELGTELARVREDDAIEGDLP